MRFESDEYISHPGEDHLTTHATDDGGLQCTKSCPELGATCWVSASDASESDTANVNAPSTAPSSLILNVHRRPFVSGIQNGVINDHFTKTLEQPYLEIVLPKPDEVVKSRHVLLVS